jgi:hypothetical protein
MAERKSGPVRPPVIDLTARPADRPKPEAAADGEVIAAENTPPTSAAEPTGLIGPPKPAEAPGSGDTAKPAETKAAADPGKPAEPKPSAKPGPASQGGAKPEQPAAAATQKAPRRASPWPAAAGGAVAGAVIAVAACYGLASAGFWPGTPDTEARLGQLQDRLAKLEGNSSDSAAAMANLNTELSGLKADVTSKLGAASDSLNQLQQHVAALQAAKPAADLAPVQDQLKTLSARVDAVAAGASSADAGALAANLATVQQNLAALGNKVAAVDAHLTATDTGVSGLRTELDSAKAAIDQAARAPSPQAIASAMQLPLLISALEADFAAGRPYADDLARLTAAVPEAHVPAAVSDAAANGLPAPDDLARSLNEAMPDILGAAPQGTDSSWQGQMGDWVKRVLALRPQGEQQGNSPEAIASRLQQAVNRHDFTGAASLFGQLPQPMQAAAGRLGAEIKTLADADGFVSGLRQSALAPAAGTKQ